MNSIRLPRILLTNDDGFDAQGLAVLGDIAQEFSNEIWTIAPLRDQSGTGQSITLHTPLKAHQRSERCWAVDGTPGDCVALALTHLMADHRPSLILSGVNAGQNVGDEVNLSGTIGAAMTGVMMGVPSIAISQACTTRATTPWETSRAILPQLLRHFLTEGWRKSTALAINLPNLPPEKIDGYKWARQASHNIASIIASKRISPRHEDYFWLEIERKEPLPTPNSDIEILHSGKVAVTTLSLDRSVEITKLPVMLQDMNLTESDDSDE